MTDFRFSPRTLGIAIAVFAIGYLVLAFQVPDFVGVEVPVQPATLPRWLGVVLLALAVALCFQRPEPDEAEPEEPAESPAKDRLGRLGDARLEVALFVGSICAYVALFELLGFVLATAAFLAAVATYLGYRRHIVTGLVSVGIPLGIYLGMTYGLEVALPAGLLPI